MTTVRPRSRLSRVTGNEHLDLVREVEVGRGLVEEQQVGVLGQRHREPRALALATGEPVEGRSRRSAVSVSPAPPRRRARPGRPLAEPALVGCRPRPTRSRTRGRPGATDPGAAAPAGGPPPGSRPRGPVRCRAAPGGRGRQQPGHGAQQGRLPQPLGPTIVVTVGDGEVEVEDDRGAAVPDGDGLDLQAGGITRRPSGGERTSSQIR